MRGFRSTGLILAAAFGSVIATPAFAQSTVCVYLRPGAGYAARMSIMSSDFQSNPSNVFEIDQTMCQPLDGVADGVMYSVVVKAVAGESRFCSPTNQPRAVSNTATITFVARGTNLNVKCEQQTAPPGTEATGAAPVPDADGAKNPPKD